MISTFLQHELKAFWRAKNTGKSVAIRIVMGVLILYLLLNVVVLGFFMAKMLAGMFHNEDVVIPFCGIILLYFLFDLLMRLQLQELPTLRVQPYLHLAIRRNTVVKYLALTAMFSFFNLWPIIIFSPFLFKVIRPDFGIAVTLAFLAAIIGISIFNNYLAMLIKRKANLNGWVFLAAIAVLVVVIMCDFYWHLFSIRSISYGFFGRLLKQPVLALIPVVLAVAMYYINFLYLKQNLYLEELSSRKVSAHKSNTEIPLLSYFGGIGDLVANEVKLILRNKRPRSALVMTLMFMFYGLLFYAGPSKGEGMKVFAAVFMTGIFIINYGQFMYSWQSSHWDGILVSKVKFADFLRAKYLLFTIISTFAFVFTTPYAYYGWHVLVVHFATYLWNIGVNTTIVLFFANRNYKRIDLSKGASFNWEGVGATQMLMGIPLFITPFLIYAPLAYFNHPDIGLAILGAVGLTFVLTRTYWIKLLEADYNEKKFKIAEGFRNK